MSPASQAIPQRPVAPCGRGERLTLIFDCEGTLTPLAAQPRLAHLDPVSRGLEPPTELAYRPPDFNALTEWLAARADALTTLRPSGRARLYP